MDVNEDRSGQTPRVLACPPTSAQIGGGESADVFRQDADTILKLFFPHVAVHTVERECTASAVAATMGLRVARPIEIVRVADRHGLLMRFLDGPVYLRQVAKSPARMTWALFAMALWQARQHAQSAPPVDLPDARLIFSHRLASSVADPAAIAAAQRIVATSPAGDRLCHGDLHLGNMIATSDGLAAIDWAKAFVGMAETDAARSELLIRYGQYGRFMRRFPPARIMRHISAEWYLLWYCALSGRPRRDVMRWRLPVAVAWMQGQGTMFAPGLVRAIARMTARYR
jgi:thiamine kinase